MSFVILDIFLSTIRQFGHLFLVVTQRPETRILEISVDFACLPIVDCIAKQKQRRTDMELRTSISSVFCARNDFATHFPRKWEIQSSNQSRLLPFRCTFSSAPNLDAHQESKPVLRRSVVSLMSTLLVAAVSSSSVGAKPINPMMVEPDLPRFRKTPSGVRIQEVVDGSGPEAKTGDTLEFDFVCRRSNGYFVYSTVDQFNDQSRPAVLPLGTGKMIPGLEEVLAGMRPGGKRRALIPPEVGYIDTSLEPLPVEFGPRRALMSHSKEPLVFEVQLLKIK